MPDYKGDGKIPKYWLSAEIIFLSIALGWAEVMEAFDIFIGANNLDYSGYPDCRPEYFHAFQALADLATQSGIQRKTF